MNANPVLLDGIRTPFGKYLKALSRLSARQLGAHAVASLVQRHPRLAAEADGVLLAQVIQAAQGQNPARQAALDGGIDPAVPATTLNNVCLGGLATVADAVRRISAGEGKSYVVGGVDSMSTAPHARSIRGATPLGEVSFTDTLLTDGLWCALDDVSMGALSEQENTRFRIDREVQDQIALRSHLLAQQARDAGRLAEEIAPIETHSGLISQDEGIREDASADSLSKLKPAFVPGGTITAGNASQMSDGASAGAVVSADTAEAWGTAPLAGIAGYAEIAGPDASLHIKPALAVQKVLARAGVSIGEVALFEINEAFAGVVEASRRELSLPMDVINVNGGAIALGHPLGGTGFRLVLTAARELKRRGEKYAVATLCGGGGQGAALLLENLD